MDNKNFLVYIEAAMIAVILGTLTLISLPHFKKAKVFKDARICVENLHSIAFAKEQWAMGSDISKAIPLPDDIMEIEAYIKGGTPVCPAGGTYTYNCIGTDPTCSIGAGLDGEKGTADDHILKK
ncbi:MAG: hypothetical protein V1893_03405 [Candidatus Omnitrophota bacterium]